MMGEIIPLLRPTEAGIYRVSDAGMEIILGDGETLWLGEVADATLSKYGVQSADFGGSGGWWIVRFGRTDATTKVIGKLCETQDAAALLYAIILKLACATGGFRA